MDYKFYVVIDAEGYRQRYVEVRVVSQGSVEIVQNYTLPQGYSLVSESPSSDFIKPRWDGSSWVEGMVGNSADDTAVTIDELKAAKIAEILALSATKTAAIEAGYSSGEVKTFEQQYSGAVDLLAGNTDTVAAQFVIALAAKRSEVGGVEVAADVLAQRIIDNYTAAREYTVYILGIQQGLTTRIQLAATREEVAAVVWPEP